jgi:hypothetical protein
MSCVGFNTVVGERGEEEEEEAAARGPARAARTSARGQDTLNPDPEPSRAGSETVTAPSSTMS